MIVAQLVRASDCGSEGRGFETHHSPKKKHPNFGCFFILYFHEILSFGDAVQNQSYRGSVTKVGEKSLKELTLLYEQ